MPNTNDLNKNSLGEDDKGVLHNAGVDVSTLPPEPDDENAKEEEVIIDIDSGVNVAEDQDLKKTGIKFVEDNKKINKEDLSSLAEEKIKKEEVKETVDVPKIQKPVNKSESNVSADLEAEFKSELSSVSPSDISKEISQKAGTLSSLLSKIQEKLGIKKTKVKEELASLKKMKDGISQDISDIKELEESEEKIKTEIEKADNIKEEIQEIEKEVKEELEK
ncbi:MAG: hypothetical protein IT284_00325 [Bacteroidetes bacterium]|nr:hypothetical protein [Bacteroidota bacterium]